MRSNLRTRSIASALAFVVAVSSFATPAWADDDGLADRIAVLESAESEDADESLEAVLKDQISNYAGTWSIYVENMTTGETVEINADEKIYGASLMKLYCLGATMEAIERGKVERTDMVENAMSKMITVSDNWSFNYLVKTVGKTAVNLWIAKNGYGSTKVRHGLSPSGNEGDVKADSKGKNETTARDCGKFLKRIYERTNVDALSSSRMLSLLKSQTRTEKIPAGVPESAETANKTGETDDVCHDSAIVWSPNADYVIVVMCSSPGNAWDRADEISAISKTVYETYNGK